jgi:hypothetical protein
MFNNYAAKIQRINETTKKKGKKKGTPLSPEMLTLNLIL